LANPYAKCGPRLKERRREVESITGAFTSAEKTRPASIANKSVVTDVCSENNVIDWGSVEIIERESNKTGGLIREAIWIRESSNVHRHEGSYQLSHD